VVSIGVAVGMAVMVALMVVVAIGLEVGAIVGVAVAVGGIIWVAVADPTANVGKIGGVVVANGSPFFKMSGKYVQSVTAQSNGGRAAVVA